MRLPPRGAKRHRKAFRTTSRVSPSPPFDARRGGVKRINALIYEEIRGVLKIFLENVIRDAVTYTEHARRKTVTAMDVVYALKRPLAEPFTALEAKFPLLNSTFHSIVLKRLLTTPLQGKTLWCLNLSSELSGMFRRPHGSRCVK
eukprot:Gb_03274 [translate_table: standard]